MVAERTDRLYIDGVEQRIIVLASTDGLQGLSLGALNRERTVIPHSETASEAWKDHHAFISFDPRTEGSTIPTVSSELQIRHTLQS